MQAATGMPIMGLDLSGMVAARSILFHEFAFYNVGGWVYFCGLILQAFKVALASILFCVYYLFMTFVLLPVIGS
jgi:hypothetical protein